MGRLAPSHELSDGSAWADRQVLLPPNFQPTARKLVENLMANGINPAAVTKVIFTHADPVHVWGTAGADGGLVFLIVAYYIGGAEWDF